MRSDGSCQSTIIVPTISQLNLAARTLGTVDIDMDAFTVLQTSRGQLFEAWLAPTIG